MFSISTPICSSPRPATSNASPPGVSVTRIATFNSASFISRSRITRLWTLDPSRPASGLSLIPNVTEIVGGSIGCAGSGFSTASAAIVSDTVALLMPASETMSPATASSIWLCPRPRKARILLTRNCSIFWPTREIACTVAPVPMRPLSTRPVRIRPRNGSAPSVVASIRNGSSVWRAWRGRGTWRTTRSKRASRLRCGALRSCTAQPARPLA